MTSQIQHRWHRPGARMDYLFDWSAYLGAGDTIASTSVVLDPPVAGMTVDAGTVVNTNTAVLVWVEGGALGDRTAVRCSVTTDDGRHDTLTLELVVGYQH